jgi:hypothetical protein
MSTIAAGTTSGTALVSTGNTDGTLQLQVNGTTPSITLAANGSIGVGSTPGYGTNGQVLTSAGTGAAPTWTTPAGSALVFISSQTVSTAVASVDFTSGIDSTYDDYQLLFENVTQSAAGDTLRFKLRQSGSFTLDGYSRATSSVVPGNTYTSQTSTNEASISANSPNASTTDTKWRGNLYLMAVNSATARVPALMGTVGSIGNSTDQFALQQLLGVSNTGAVVTGLRIQFSTGNISSGTFRLYGIAKS